MKIITATVLLALLLVSAPGEAQTNTVIVPGQSIGPFRVGANVNDAVPLLGPLVNKTDSRTRKYTLYQWPLRPFFIVADRETSRIVMITVQFSDAYQTDKGITAGSERQAVEAAYGQAFLTEDDPGSVALIYNALGMTLEVGKIGAMAGRVVAITVFPPTQWRQITADL